MSAGRTYRIGPRGCFRASIANQDEVARGVGGQMFELMATEIEARKSAPCDDVLTAITQATIDGAEVSDEVRWGMAQVLKIAGHETTTNAIGNLVHQLASRPELQLAVVSDPDMMAKAIDESLRYESPVFGLGRTVVSDTEVGGVALCEGDRVLVCFGAANHDPRHFPDPERFDPDRQEKRCHVAFGYGRHRCIGEHLARLEVEVVIDELLRQIPQYQLAPGTEVEMKNAVVRGPMRLDIVWNP